MTYWSIPGRRPTRNSRQFQNLSLRMAAPGETGGTVATAATEIFIIDPFAGNINPGTTRGQKLFTKACSALDEGDKLKASIANQHAVMEHIMLAVKLTFDLTKTKILITESFALSVEDLKVQAYKIWGGGIDTATSVPLNPATNCSDLILTDINITTVLTNQEKKFSMPVCGQP